MKSLCLECIFPIITLSGCLLLKVIKLVNDSRTRKKQTKAENNQTMTDQNRTESMYSCGSQSNAPLKPRSGSTITNTFRLQRMKVEREVTNTGIVLAAEMIIAASIRMIGIVFEEIKFINIGNFFCFLAHLLSIFGGTFLALLGVVLFLITQGDVRQQVLFFVSFGRYGKKLIAANEEAEGTANNQTLQQPTQRRRKCTPIPTDYRYVASHLFPLDEAL